LSAWWLRRLRVQPWRRRLAPCEALGANLGIELASFEARSRPCAAGSLHAEHLRPTPGFVGRVDEVARVQFSVVSPELQPAPSRLPRASCHAPLDRLPSPRTGHEPLPSWREHGRNRA